MKICIISRGLPKDGTGIFEYDQAKALHNAGHDITLIALDLRSLRHFRKPGITWMKKDGIKIVKQDVPLGAIPKKVFYKLGVAAFKKAFDYAQKKSGGFDIVHAHFTDLAYIAAKSLENTEYENKLVITEHSSAVNRELNQINKDIAAAAEFAYKKAAKVIAVSESLSATIKNNFGENCITIGNIVDVDAFTMSQGEKKQSESLSIISVGNLKKNKRMDLLIEGFGEFLQRGIFDAELTIVGAGEEEPLLKQLVAERGLQDKTTFTGKLSREEIAGLFAESDFFMLCSEKETFGVVFIEAMAAGLPVVSTKNGGSEGFLNTDVGLLINDDIEDIAEAIEYMGKNLRRFDRNRISDYSKTNFSPGAIAEKLNSVYESIKK